MSLARPRVFISSLMQGYGDARSAAADAIHRAGCEPVRAEDFPAAATSPRTACLDGVASSDAVCFLLGPHYLAAGGTLVPSGLSATHEEYNEAIRLRKPVFVFLDYRDERPIEPRQQAFIDQVTGYVGGHWRKTFRLLDDLGTLLETALGEAEPMITADGAANGAATRLEGAFGADLPQGDHLVWLQIAWATLRDEEVVDPLLLIDPGYERQMQELAHAGSAPLFAYTQAKHPSADASRLRLVQGDPHEWRAESDVVIVDIYENGTLAIAANVTGQGRASGLGESLAASHYLDPRQVARRLEQAWGFASRWWDNQDAWARHANLDYNAALRHVGMRRFGAPPPQQGHSYTFTAPSRDTPDPVWVYPRPRRIGRGDLHTPMTEIDRIVRLFGLHLADTRA